MKYIKNINERRNLRDYIKYKDIIKRKFKNYIRIDKIDVFEDDNKYYITIKNWGSVDKDFFQLLDSELKTYNYNIMPSNGWSINNIYI